MSFLIFSLLSVLNFLLEVSFTLFALLLSFLFSTVCKLSFLPRTFGFRVWLTECAWFVVVIFVIAVGEIDFFAAFMSVIVRACVCACARVCTCVCVSAGVLV